MSGSGKQSACIPPPSDYAPRARPPQSTKYRERGGKGGRGGGGGCYKRRPGQSTTFHREFDDDKDRTKHQPQDRFHRNEDDDYFARFQDDDEEENCESNVAKAESNDNNNTEDEDDPLDAYMKSLEGNTDDQNNKTQSTSTKHDSLQTNSEEAADASTSTGQQQEFDKRGVRLDIDETDDIEESYYNYVEQTRGKKQGEQESEDSEDRQNLIEYDRDGNIISVRKVKKEIEPLPPIDHSIIEYEPFEKDFYREHMEIEKLTQEQGEELRSKLEIKVSGQLPPKPVCSFAHFRFDEQLMRVIRRSEYTQPTPIQAQAIPAALLGRNIIGIAMTGSGKTAAYLWPMIVHIMGQKDLKQGDGPIALVLVPTRELALQVYGEAKKFSNSYEIAVVCAYGGGSRYEQSRDLEAGAEIVVATPGRLIDLIKMGATNLSRVTYLVLDEADRFFDMGFEAQVRSICDHIRPDRQTLLFSATFKKKIEHLARTVTENPVKIVQKSLGEANEDVTQHVIMFPIEAKKWDWLVSKLVEFTSSGSVLIFVTRIVNSEELHKNLKEQGTEALLLHGDMEQSERNRVITSFKRKEKDIMIATDVAARGLDISHIRTVINYDVARDIDTHTHRVGRTGRAGSKGDAYTLISDKDKEFAGHLVKNLESSNQVVSEELMKLAKSSHAFRKSNQSKSHKGDRHSSSSTPSTHHQSHQHNRHNRHHNHNHHHHREGSGSRPHYESYSRDHHNNHHHKQRHHSGNREDRGSPRGSNNGNYQERGHSSSGSRLGTSDHHSSSDREDHRKRSKWH